MPPFDFHTHNPEADPRNSVLSLEPDQPIPPNRLCSVGVHPWHIANANLSAIDHLISLPQVVAVGEAGLDALRSDAPMDCQINLLRAQALMAERVSKPLVLHIVKAWQQLMALQAELRPTVPWVVHGFRGNATLASQLLDKGLYISLGPRLNPKAATVIPPNRLLIETDNSSLDISHVAAMLPAHRASESAALARTILKLGCRPC